MGLCMNWFRVIGSIISPAGTGIFIVALLLSIPQGNASARIGVINITGLFFGAILVLIGLCLTIIGGRYKKLQ